MTFDLTQPSPKPTTLAECYKLIERLYGYLKKGTRLVGTPTTRFCAKLLRERKSLWHFLKKSTIDSTNNLAERNIRHFVLWRRKPFGKL